MTVLSHMYIHTDKIRPWGGHTASSGLGPFTVALLHPVVGWRGSDTDRQASGGLTKSYVLVLVFTVLATCAMWVSRKETLRKVKEREVK